MRPPWLKLLDQWQDANRFGLTVPFVYGALDRWPGEVLGGDPLPQARFATMLRRMADETPEGAIVRLFKCGTVQDLTFAPMFGVPGFCIAIPSASHRSPSLWVQKDLLPPGEPSSQALAAFLWSRYSAPISENRFSLRQGTFVPFTDVDLQLIERAVVRDDDDDA